ncbi:MAG: lipid-A-disaccharide synthase N-terminal domain-containing protein [Phycisphaerae bacterium]|nr:lipid-A-disaccharide synthase N-terminal domain-containing protein [Phycisphaerae bacterium]
MYDYLVKVATTPFINLEWWDVVGFVGQVVFFGRFVIQWLASEKKKRTVIPVAFWYISLVGAFITLLYSIHLGKLVFILAFSLSSIIYIRNLVIYYRRRTSRKGLQFAVDSPVAEDDMGNESAD